MKNIFVCAALVFLVIAWTSNRSFAQTAEELYQKGVQLEEVKGELEKAIEVYKSVVSKHASNNPLAAKSLLRMGRCYEKLGLGKDEAKKAYERIVKEYASQLDAVAEARARLAVLMDGTKLGGSPIARRLISDNVRPEIRNPGTMTPSPDGRWVAYTQGSEVCVRNLESGEVKQVAPGQPTSTSFSVVWSVDGRRLAFPQVDKKTNVGAIKIHDLTSGETAAVPGLDASKLYILDWSHDGRYLLCNHERNTLELVTIKDGTMRTLSDSVWYGQRASFSPDSRFVTFASGKYGSESAYTQPIAGGPRHRVAETERGQMGAYLSPLWSPDGRAIAYQQSSGIWVVPVTNGVASGPGRLAYKTNIARWPVTWTEAGGFYVTYYAERFQAYKVTVDPRTGQPGNAEPQKIPDAPGDLSSFAWAPDAQHITYTGWGNTIRLYATDTKTMTSYDVGSRAYGPSRSSNGREVLFNTFDPSSEKGFLRALDPVSGQTRDLFPPITGFGFSLSADGQQMAFMPRHANSGSREVIVAATGHPDGRVVAAGPMMNAFQLSPQGNQVFFVRKGDASPQDGGPNGASLWVVAADGSGARRLASAWGINSAVWDPSGRFIAYIAKPDSGAKARVIRIVEVATGVQRGNVPLAELRGEYSMLCDWSGDGRYIGFWTSKPWWEYWVVQGLQDGVR